MVTVFLRGGLGNQMFQYAAGLALAKRNGGGLVLDTVFLNDRFPRKDFTYRTYDLDIFRTEPDLTTLSKLSSMAPIPGLWLTMDLAGMEIAKRMGVKQIVKEKDDGIFDGEVREAKGNVVLWGRWQSEKYFADAVDDVRAAFVFRHPLSGIAADTSDDICSSASVSVHVRRGDFASSKAVIGIMGETDLSYYRRAAAYIAERVPHPKFFVFSDDIDWCKKNLDIGYPATYVMNEAAGPKGAFHLQLMSFCKHNIIANSTFSWWGAWLNRDPGKIVIAPERWYADRETKQETIPDSWIKL